MMPAMSYWPPCEEKLIGFGLHDHSPRSPYFSLGSEVCPRRLHFQLGQPSTNIARDQALGPLKHPGDVARSSTVAGDGRKLVAFFAILQETEVVARWVAYANETP
jgi:hypothetical protein